MKILRQFRLAIAVAAIFGFNNASKAQSISMGIRGGGNYSTLLGIDSAEFKTGITGGITLNYQTAGKWSISADVVTLFSASFLALYGNKGSAARFETCSFSAVGAYL